MHGLKVRSSVGLVFTALLLSVACGDSNSGLPSEGTRADAEGTRADGLADIACQVQARGCPDWELPDESRYGEGLEEPQPDLLANKTDVEQPVSDLKAEFHFGQTSGCPFMQAVDVAGVAENADVSLKLSIDGNPVDNTAEFITEGEYVKEGFDGYFDLVAGDDFNAALEGEHTLKVEVSDGVGSAEIEGKFTADSC